MPDRQRHGRLSELFAGLFAARSAKPPAAAGRHRGAAPAGAGMAAEQRGVAGYRNLGDDPRRTMHPYEPFAPDAGSGDRTPAAGPSGPLWPDDPSAVTMELSRAAWQPSDPQDRPADRPDPTADTTLLRRVVPPRPAAGPASPASAADSGLNAGVGVDADADVDVEAEAEAAAEAAAAAGPPRGPLRSWSARSLFERHRRRLAVGAAGVAALAALLALPPVRAQLRDSFTKLPKPYTALYFKTPPQVDGTVLTVPVSVHAVDTGTSTYSVRVWTVDAQGRVDDNRTADLTWDGQALSAVVSMPVNPAATYVWVSLSGSTETLHYKIAVA